MSDPEVVVRLLAAIDERARKAEAAARLQWDSEDGWGRDGHTLIPHIGVIHEDQSLEHILANDPPAVLRLCQSHRDIVDMFPVSEPHLDTEGSFYGFQSRHPPQQPRTGQAVRPPPQRAGRTTGLRAHRHRSRSQLPGRGDGRA